MGCRLQCFLALAVGLLIAVRSQAIERYPTGDPAVLTNIQQVLEWGNDRLLRARKPVRLSALLTGIYPEEHRLFLQEGTNAIMAKYAGLLTGLKSGQLVEIEGEAASYAIQPIIHANNARVLGLGSMPVPKPSNTGTLMGGGDVARYVRFRGFVRDMLSENGTLYLMLYSDFTHIRFCVPNPDGSPLPRDLLDAEVEVTGVCLHLIDGLKHITGVRIMSTGLENLRVITPGIPSLFDRPLVTIDRAHKSPPDGAHRMKVSGIVTVHVPGGVLFVEDDTGAASVMPSLLIPSITGPSLTLEHTPQIPLEPGDRVELIGVRSDHGNPQTFLYESEYHVIGHGDAPAPVHMSISDVRSLKHLHHVVNIDGRLISCVVGVYNNSPSHIWTIESNGELLQVRLENRTIGGMNFEVGQWLSVTGVLDCDDYSVSVNGPNLGYFVLRVRNNRDMAVVSPPPFWMRSEYRLAGGAVSLVGGVALMFIALQRRRLRQIRASEERCRALIDNSFDATVVLTAEGRVKYLSPAGKRLLGMEQFKGDWQSISVADVVHPADLSRIMEAHLEVLKVPGASKRVLGYGIRRADGSVRHAEAVGTNCLHVPGVNGVVVNIRDVTDRTLADEAAKRSDAIARTVNYFASSLLECDTEEAVLWDLAENCISQLGFADCVVYLIDENGPNLLQKAATGPKSSNGRTIVNPITIPLGKGIAGSAAATGLPELVADTRLDPRYIVDDQVRLSELAVPIVAEGEVLGVIDSEHPDQGFFTGDHLATLTAIAGLCANKLVRIRAVQDLRELNARLEQHVAFRTAALRQSEERFSKAFQASPAILSIMRLPGGEYLDVNDSFLEAFGFARSEVIGRNYRELGLWQEPGECEAASRALMAGKEVRNLESVCRTKAGEHRLVLQSAELIQLGEERCVLSVGQDITERKRADEELLRALEREKELNQLKSNFVSMVSHEFRTPLEVILSSNNILDRYFDRLTPEKRAAQLRAIRKNVRRMNDLLDDVLLLGRIEAGRLDCHPVQIDLAEFCRRAVVDIESAAGVSGRILVSFHGLDSEATADETILQHILSNLLGNALKYSPAGSAVEFAVSRAEGNAEFIVRDLGCGIPEQDRESLFTAFHRGGNVGQIPGSGLGLVIVRRCVESHGGTLSYSSVEGQGTTFNIVLPVFSGTRFFRKTTHSTLTETAATESPLPAA